MSSKPTEILFHPDFIVDFVSDREKDGGRNHLHHGRQVVLS